MERARDYVVHIPIVHVESAYIITQNFCLSSSNFKIGGAFCESNRYFRHDLSVFGACGTMIPAFFERRLK